MSDQVKTYTFDFNGNTYRGIPRWVAAEMIMQCEVDHIPSDKIEEWLQRQGFVGAFIRASPRERVLWLQRETTHGTIETLRSGEASSPGTGG